MSRVNTYLNFSRNTEEAFNFYQSVFGGEFVEGIHRFSEVPTSDGKPPLADADKNLIMHICLPILGGHLLLGTDAPESMGFHLENGNKVYIDLEPDTIEETEKLFSLLSAGGKVEEPLKVMFWGGYYGSITDKFGIKWMFNCSVKK